MSDGESSETGFPERSGRKRRLLIRACFSGVVLVALMVALELTLRLFGVTFYPQAITLSADRNEELAEVVLQADGQLQWVVSPNTLQGTPLAVNSHGMRGREISASKPQGTIRILCMGDSCTFGARTASPYPVLLEELLSARFDRSIEVLNAGVPGHASHQGVGLLERYLKFSPDFVVVYYGWNDHWLKTTALSGPKLPDPPITDHVLILRGLRLAWERAQARSAIREEEEDIDMVRTELRLPPLHYWAMLDEFAVLGKRHGFQVVYMTAPSALNREVVRWIIEEQGWAKPETNLPELHEYYNNITREIAEDKGAVLVDLAQVFAERSDEPLIHSDGVHPSQAGHALIAQTLFTAIEPLLENAP